jgi:hypothetical protein
MFTVAMIGGGAGVEIEEEFITADGEPVNACAYSRADGRRYCATRGGHWYQFNSSVASSFHSLTKTIIAR